MCNSFWTGKAGRRCSCSCFCLNREKVGAIHSIQENGFVFLPWSISLKSLKIIGLWVVTEVIGGRPFPLSTQRQGLMDATGKEKSGFRIHYN